MRFFIDEIRSAFVMKAFVLLLLFGCQQYLVAHGRNIPSNLNWICEDAAPCVRAIRPKGGLATVSSEENEYTLQIGVHMRKTDQDRALAKWSSVEANPTWSVSVKWYRLVEAKMRVPLPTCRDKLLCRVALVSDESEQSIASDDDKPSDYIYRHYLVEASFQGHPSTTHMEMIVRKSAKVYDAVEPSPIVELGAETGEGSNTVWPPVAESIAPGAFDLPPFPTLTPPAESVTYNKPKNHPKYDWLFGRDQPSDKLADEDSQDWTGNDVDPIDDKYPDIIDDVMAGHVVANDEGAPNTVDRGSEFSRNSFDDDWGWSSYLDDSYADDRSNLSDNSTLTGNGPPNKGEIIALGILVPTTFLALLFFACKCCCRAKKGVQFGRRADYHPLLSRGPADPESLSGSESEDGSSDEDEIFSKDKKKKGLFGGKTVKKLGEKYLSEESREKAKELKRQFKKGKRKADKLKEKLAAGKEKAKEIKDKVFSEKNKAKVKKIKETIFSDKNKAKAKKIKKKLKGAKDLTVDAVKAIGRSGKSNNEGKGRAYNICAALWALLVGIFQICCCGGGYAKSSAAERSTSSDDSSSGSDSDSNPTNTASTTTATTTANGSSDTSSTSGGGSGSEDARESLAPSLGPPNSVQPQMDIGGRFRSSPRRSRDDVIVTSPPSPLRHEVLAVQPQVSATSSDTSLRTSGNATASTSMTSLSSGGERHATRDAKSNGDAPSCSTSSQPQERPLPGVLRRTRESFRRENRRMQALLEGWESRTASSGSAERARSHVEKQRMAARRRALSTESDRFLRLGDKSADKEFPPKLLSRKERLSRTLQLESSKAPVDGSSKTRQSASRIRSPKKQPKEKQATGNVTSTTYTSSSSDDVYENTSQVGQDIDRQSRARKSETVANGTIATSSGHAMTSFPTEKGVVTKAPRASQVLRSTATAWVDSEASEVLSDNDEYEFWNGATPPPAR